MRPTSITLNRQNQSLVLPWDDGHTSEFPLAGLREACPCVECRGGHENMGQPPDPDLMIFIPLAPKKSYEIKRLALAGNYALQPEWDDGHHHGIYTWAYLRALCPCAECQAKRKAEGGKQ
jgi:DUF971 family protein